MVNKEGQVEHEMSCLNEVALNRGLNPQMCKLDLYLDGLLLAQTSGDGLLISTPTGSTAYSLAAGGSILHPQVEVIQIVPIAPHSICSRPIVVKDEAEIELRLNEKARNRVIVTGDGINSFQLKKGAKLVIKKAEFPLKIVYKKGVKKEVKEEEEKESDWLKTFFWGELLNKKKNECKSQLNPCKIEK